MTNPPLFRDRASAGARLAAALGDGAPDDALVLGLSGGGVVVAAVVARSLSLPLHMAVIESGGGTRNRMEATSRMRANLHDTPFLSVSGRSVASEMGRNADTISDIEDRRAEHHDLPDVNGLAVILVDDGLHPDDMVHTALMAVRARGARMVTLATPFLTATSRDMHDSECDRIVALNVLEEYGAATDFYADLEPPTPEQVRGLLAGVAAP